MKEKGFVFLPPNFDAFSTEEALEHLSVSFVRWSDVTRSVKESTEQISFSALSKHLADYPVESLIGVLPQASVTFLDVTVPTKKARQLKQALPFLVEEQTAQEPDSLLLVSDFNVSDENTLKVIAIAKELLNQALDIFTASTLAVTELYAIEQLLPELEQQMLVLVDNQTSYLFSSNQTPLSLTTTQLPWLFKKYINTDAQDGLLNINLVVTDHTEKDYSEIESLIEGALPAGITAELYSKKVTDIASFLAPVAASEASNSAYYQSLLVGSYKPKKKSNPWLTMLTPSLVFGSVVLCCHMALTLYSGWQYQQKAHQLQSQIHSTVKKAIPDVRLEKLNSDAKLRSRIKSQLNRTKGGTSTLALDKITSDLITALSAYSKENQPYLQRISYRSSTGETQVELHASSFAQVDQFKESLGQSGYQVTVGSVSNDNGLFKGRLTLSGKEG